ncbi:MAG: InlB B-repeat-containing protein [Clostridia bacterium]|nr:InlB B-repeat-containing protein [Clostridia bacterium]
MKRFHKLTVWALNIAILMTFIPSLTLTVSADDTEIALLATSYTVTVSANSAEGGTVTGGGTYPENYSLTVTATANSGYKFVKWTEDGSQVSTDASYTFPVTVNRNLTAEFIKTYTVVFNSNNGANETDSETLADGSSLTLANDIFTYGRCEIKSWNTEADGSGSAYNTDADMTVTQDITLYAQWVLPLNKYDSFSDGDYEWSGNASPPYSFTMKNGAVLYAGVIFPSATNDDKTTITVDGNCEIKGSLSFVSGTDLFGSSHRGDLTIKGGGTLKAYQMSATGSGDTLTVETDVTFASNLSIGASGGMDSKIVIKDSILTVHDLTLLQYLIMEEEAKLNIIDGTASFHSNPEINISDKSEIYIGGNGVDCVLYKEGEDNNEDFDALISNQWLPQGYSFKKENYKYYLYNPENIIATDAITIKQQGYTVIFKNWDGSELDKQFVGDGASATAPVNPTRDGWTFIGWDKAFDNVKGDLTVTAQYITQSGGRPSGGGGGVSRCTVEFETNGGTAVANKYVTRNTKITEPTAPAKDGYTFNGWYTDEELTEAYDFDTKVTKSFTLYAKWDKHDDEQSDRGTHNCPSLAFDDLDITKWYHHDTDYVIENDIFRGTTENTFTPDGNITRGMMITVLYRAEGEPEVTGKATFQDIDEKAYYAKAVLWGQKTGIIKGYSETEYAPEQPVLREEIAAIMHRYAQYKGYDVSVGENTNILSYDDFDNISEYAIASVQWAVGRGIIKGRTEKTLDPHDFATRVEIAAMLHRFIEANK